MRSGVIRAIAARDVRRAFGNPTGYVFITLFIFIGAAAAFWRPRFFLNNLANLQQLNEVFPYLLVFFVAALAMGAWSEERKHGTDELLLTLPATDLDVTLGKYAAVLIVYTAALALSLSHAAVLFWLGAPDRGMLAGAYLGYWLAGAALIPAAMLASLLTPNAAVAFVLAALFSSVPVAVDLVVSTFNETLAPRTALAGLGHHFNDFASGVVSVAGLTYFAAVAAFGLYLNVIVLGRRHWLHGDVRPPMAVHHIIRGVALAGALAALVALASRIDVRLDLTAERLHSLGPDTRRLLAELPRDRQVLVHAFVSPDMPEEYVQQRESVLNALREMQALAGPALQVDIQTVEPYSDRARAARERFGIVPRLVANASSVRSDMQEVYLAAACQSGAEEHIIPFFEHGLSVEYELMRAIRSAAETTRRRIGLVDGDVKMAGGVDFQGGRTRFPWAIVSELRKQYEVSAITPWQRIDESLDALIVAMPTTLLQHELDNVLEAVRRGVPTVMLVDPLPAFDMRLAPAASMAARLNPYAVPGQALVRKNTGDIQKALASIGVSWPPARIAWDGFRPPEMAQAPREIVFVGSGSGNANAIDSTHPAASGLQQVMLLYPGHFTPSDAAGFTFRPLLSTGTLSGTNSYFQLVQPSEAGPVLNLKAPHESENTALTVAAHVRSSTVNAIVIADLDFVSDQAFAFRAGDASSVAVDNIAFFLNCIDALAGDDAFIALRGRRAKYRTLERVETQTRAFLERRNQEERQAAAEAEAALAAAQASLQKTVDAIAARADLDAQAKQILARNVEETENRKLDVLRANIEQTKNARVQSSREVMEAQVRRIQGTIRLTAVAAPPLPICALGILIYLRRRRRERDGAAAVRRLRGMA